MVYFYSMPTIFLNLEWIRATTDLHLTSLLRIHFFTCMVIEQIDFFFKLPFSGWHFNWFSSLESLNFKLVFKSLPSDFITVIQYSPSIPLMKTCPISFFFVPFIIYLNSLLWLCFPYILLRYSFSLLKSQPPTVWAGHITIPFIFLLRNY